MIYTERFTDPQDLQERFNQIASLIITQRDQDDHELCECLSVWNGLCYPKDLPHEQIASEFSEGKKVSIKETWTLDLCAENAYEAMFDPYDTAVDPYAVNVEKIVPELTRLAKAFDLVFDPDNFSMNP